MNREEEIIEASQLYAKYQQKPFMDGALWSDQHPRKGLVDIDKACRAFCKSVCKGYQQAGKKCFADGGCAEYYKFRKSMEE